MRILMIPVGSAGDVHPHVGIGLALQRRGHDVSVLTSAYFEPLLSRVGLPLVPLGTVDDYRRTLEHPDLWRPHRALGVIGEAIRPHVTEIARVLREQTRKILRSWWRTPWRSVRASRRRPSVCGW